MKPRNSECGLGKAEHWVLGPDFYHSLSDLERVTVPL